MVGEVRLWIDRDDRVVIVVVDLGEVAQLRLRQATVQCQEAPVARTLAQPLETLEKPLLVTGEVGRISSASALAQPLRHSAAALRAGRGTACLLRCGRRRPSGTLTRRALRLLPRSDGRGELLEVLEQTRVGLPRVTTDACNPFAKSV